MIYRTFSVPLSQCSCEGDRSDSRGCRSFLRATVPAAKQLHCGFIKETCADFRRHKGCKGSNVAIAMP